MNQYSATAPEQHPAGALARQVGLAGATMMGLGSIIGTGVFLSIAIAAGSAGPAVTCCYTWPLARSP